MPEQSPAADARAELRRARQEAAARRAGLPSLHLLIWADASALRLSLVVYYTTPGQRRTCRVLRDASWHPKEVTERKLVEWGQRALSSYLEDPVIDHIEYDRVDFT